jgi:hypothetical protein
MTACQVAKVIIWSARTSVDFFNGLDAMRRNVRLVLGTFWPKEPAGTYQGIDTSGPDAIRCYRVNLAIEITLWSAYSVIIFPRD